MKKLLLSVAALSCFVSTQAQNVFPPSGPVGINTGSAPLAPASSPSSLNVKGSIAIWDGTLDGTNVFQKSVIYCDPTIGLYFDAARTSSNQRLNIRVVFSADFKLKGYSRQ